MEVRNGSYRTIDRKEVGQVKRSAGFRLAAIIFLLCMIICSGASAEMMQEEDGMIEYNFMVFTNVKITGVDLDSLTKEELSVFLIFHEHSPRGSPNWGGAGVGNKRQGQQLQYCGP